MGRKKTAKIINFSTYSGYSLNNEKVNKNKKENNKRKEEKIKNKKKKNNRIKIRGKFILFLLIIIAICCFCLFTPSFNVNTIHIEGVNQTEYIDQLNYNSEEHKVENNTYLENEKVVENEEYVKTNHYSKQEIIDMAQIVMGTNIFKMSVNNIEKNIEKAPYIKNVTVKRVLPSTIKIEIEEREIKAYVDYIGAYMCIDETCFCIDSIKKENKVEGIPIVRGITPIDSIQGFIVGEILNTEDNIKVQRISNLLNLIEKNELTLDILEIDVTDKDNVVVSINNGDIKINFGDMSNINVKIPFLPAILEDKQGKKGIIYMNSDSDNIEPIFSEIIGG